MTCSAYECDDTLVPDKSELCDRVMSLLQSYHCTGDELLGLFSEINRLGQTVLMVTHSVKAASTAGRVLFIKDGQVFHQIYRGQDTDRELYQKISDTLTLLCAEGERA